MRAVSVLAIEIDAPVAYVVLVQVGQRRHWSVAEGGVGEKPGAARPVRSHEAIPVRGGEVCVVKAPALGACLLLIADEVARAIPAVEIALGDRAR